MCHWLKEHHIIGNAMLVHVNEFPAKPKSKSHMRFESQSLTGHESESPVGPKNA